MKPYLYLYTLCVLTACTNRTTNQQLKVADSADQVIVPIKKPLNTGFFEITLEKYWVLPRVNTGDEYTSLPKEKGIKYLIMNFNYKNIDTESRMISDGQVFITYNGKNYNFDHNETVLRKGWVTGLEQINPLTTITAVFVFKLPKEITGTAYFHPGRSDDKHFIEVGKIQ